VAGLRTLETKRAPSYHSFIALDILLFVIADSFSRKLQAHPVAMMNQLKPVRGRVLLLETDVAELKHQAEFWPGLAVREPTASMLQTTQDTSAEVWNSDDLSGPKKYESSNELLTVLDIVVSLA